MNINFLKSKPLSVLVLSLVVLSIFSSTVIAGAYEGDRKINCDIDGNHREEYRDSRYLLSCWNHPADYVSEYGKCKVVDTDKDGFIHINDVQRYAYSCPHIFYQ